MALARHLKRMKLVSVSQSESEAMGPVRALKQTQKTIVLMYFH